MIPGIDVGAPQGNISLADWQKLRSQGMRFAYCRCTEALGTVDGTYHANVTGALAAGLAVGAYSVIHPWLDSVAQAKAHYAAVGGVGLAPGNLPPVVDCELPAPEDWAKHGVTAASILQALITYENTASLLWKRPIVMYTYPYWMNAVAKGGDTTPLASTFLWLASYEANAPKPLAPWEAVTVWQCGGGKDGFKVPSGAPSDHDQFLGDESAFAAFCDPSVQVVVPLSSES